MRTWHFLWATGAVVFGAATPALAQTEGGKAPGPVEPAPRARPTAPVEPAPRARPTAPVEPAPRGGSVKLRSSSPVEIDAELKRQREAERTQEGFLLADEDGRGRDRFRAYVGAAGLRPTVTDVSGGLGADRALGLTLGWQAASASTDHRGMASLTRGFAFIGGGSGGFEGGFGGGLYGGWRAPFGKTHGPVGRVGAFGMLAGNDLIYDSRLELPQAQLGYQVFTDDLFFEVGFQPGAVLAGRFDPLDGAARKLNGTFDLGVYASAWASWVRLDLEARRFVGRERDGQGDLSEARGTLCALLRGAVACLDARHDRGDVPRGDGSYALVRATYAGVLFGFNVRE